ncbi:PKD domain-containing protein [Kribbella sp. VKM Ac-2527]|uniref:PKD domain-containing protein n=1 Tax=Kribbella caucasensis TaxID=2512215 RepID=A0A4R6K294_9ACTN|nr:PKD domain-containing protein [Kribbella sp. VKM Ac-2527]
MMTFALGEWNHVRRRVCSIVLAIVTAIAVWVVPVQAGQAVQVVQDRVVSADPANFTPNVLDGSVKAILQVGNTILIGGVFNQIQAASGGPVLARRNLAAFDATTGAISTTFVPNPDGEVTTIIPSGDGTTVYIGGYFNNVSGAGSPSTARINATTGARIATFQAPTLNGRVKDMRLVGNRLWLAGYFTHVEGQAQAALATVNATTGAYDPFMDLNIAGVHNGGNTTVMKMDVTPNGSHLVAIGNFDTIQGVRHHQVFMLNLTGAAATVENWQTNFYNTACSSSFQSYMRDLDFSPDGSYFVISTTGAYGGANTACDSTARFNTNVRGSNLSYRWIDNTGGDTTYAVAITGTAVYVGGHQRWQNNPFAGDRPGQGAVSRPGIAALDPSNGLPFSWNPTRERGVGVFDLLATTAGLWVGSDTEHLGANFEYHPRIAFFPLAGGTVVAPNVTPSLPNDIYLAGPLVPPANTVSRTSYDGTTFGARTSVGSGGIAWTSNRGAFMLNGQLYAGWSDGSFNRRTYNGATFGTPAVINTGDQLVTMTTWHNEVAQITGMFFDSGRLYYTLTGQSSLFFRYFTPESGVVGANRFTATGNVAGVNFSQVNGMFVTPTGFYWASLVDGDLRRAGWSPDAGAPTGSSTVVSTDEWRARGLFLYQGVAPPPNQPPVAQFSVNCSALNCSYSSAGSTDPDGTITSYAWTFGDGGTGTGPSPTHTYGAAGTYTVTLTVTDNGGATGQRAQTVTVSTGTPGAVTFVGANSVNLNTTQFGVTVPPAVTAGDLLLLFFADNDPAPTVTAPAGWTQVQTASSTNQQGRVWRRTATAGDAGTTVSVLTSAATKANATLVAYRGVSGTTPVAASAAGSETIAQTTHTTPTVNSPVSGARLVSYWGEKSSLTTVLSAPAGLSVRASSTGSGSGRITSLAGDSGPFGAGTLGGLTATADSASARVLMFSVVVAPAP